MFRDLKALTSHQRNFKALRNVQDGLAAAYGPPGQSQAEGGKADGARVSTSAARAPKATGCIPFLGELFSLLEFLRSLTLC